MSKPKQLKFFSSSGPTFFRLDEDIKKLSVDRSSYWAIRITLILLVAVLVLILFFYHRLPEQIPMFYSRPWGTDQLVNKNYVYFFFAAMFVFSAVNWVLASRNKSTNPVISQIFVWTSFIIVLMGMIDLVKIYLLLSIW